MNSLLAAVLRLETTSQTPGGAGGLVQIDGGTPTEFLIGRCVVGSEIFAFPTSPGDGDVAASRAVR